MNDDLYHLAQDGQNTGPFTLAQVREKWQAGTLSPQTLFWQPGAAEWQPISALAPVLRGEVSPAFLQSGGPPETSGAAIASLVLGLMSLIFSVLTALPAIICGHVALSQINRSGGRLAGRGMAITGLICGYFFGIIIFLILLGIAVPVFTTVSTRANATRDLMQAEQVALVIKLYEGDHEGKTPPDLDALYPTYLQDKSVLVSRLSAGKSPAVELMIPNVKADDLDPHTVLLRGRFTTPDHRRVYVYNDASGELKRDP